MESKAPLEAAGHTILGLWDGLRPSPGALWVMGRWRQSRTPSIGRSLPRPGTLRQRQPDPKGVFRMWPQGGAGRGRWWRWGRGGSGELWWRGHVPSPGLPQPLAQNNRNSSQCGGRIRDHCCWRLAAAPVLWAAPAALPALSWVLSLRVCLAKNTGHVGSGPSVLQADLVLTVFTSSKTSSPNEDTVTGTRGQDLDAPVWGHNLAQHRRDRLGQEAGCCHTCSESRAVCGEGSSRGCWPLT